jgi:hypothetical protein
LGFLGEEIYLAHIEIGDPVVDARERMGHKGSSIKLVLYDVTKMALI